MTPCHIVMKTPNIFKFNLLLLRKERHMFRLLAILKMTNILTCFIKIKISTCYLVARDISKRTRKLLLVGRTEQSATLVVESSLVKFFNLGKMTPVSHEKCPQFLERKKKTGEREKEKKNIHTKNDMFKLLQMPI